NTSTRRGKLVLTSWSTAGKPCGSHFAARVCSRPRNAWDCAASDQEDHSASWEDWMKPLTTPTIVMAASARETTVSAMENPALPWLLFGRMFTIGLTLLPSVCDELLFSNYIATPPGLGGSRRGRLFSKAKSEEDRPERRRRKGSGYRYFASSAWLV